MIVSVGTAVWRRRAVLSPLLFMLALTGCYQKLGLPTAAPIGDDAPVALRNLELATVEGHRAVLLRLSRLPTLVRHSSSKHPGQIVVQAWGPVGEELAERILPQSDGQISQVRVSRHDGGLSVVFDFQADEPPAYTVQEMADWIMIRFAPTEG